MLKQTAEIEDTKHAILIQRILQSLCDYYIDFVLSKIEISFDMIKAFSCHQQYQPGHSYVKILKLRKCFIVAIMISA